MRPVPKAQGLKHAERPSQEGTVVEGTVFRNELSPDVDEVREFEDECGWSRLLRHPFPAITRSARYELHGHTAALGGPTSVPRRVDTHGQSLGERLWRIVQWQVPGRVLDRELLDTVLESQVLA